MFPINWNDVFRKKDGTFINMEDVGNNSSEIQALTNYVADTGVKNLLPNNATTQTVNGITFTANSDGTVTVNGTATGNAICWMIGTASDIFASGSYKMSGCPSGGSATTYCLRVYSGGNTVASDTGSGATFTNVSGAQIGIVIFSGTVMDNAVFKPMITLSDIPDSDYAHYQPYAKTNVELTQDASWLTSAKTYYDANTDPTVKQNHYNVAKYFYDFINPGESHTVIIRYAGGYYDTMILSRDNNTGLFCVDFCHADGLGKILYFRYNGTSDTFTDLFSVT